MITHNTNLQDMIKNGTITISQLTNNIKSETSATSKISAAIQNTITLSKKQSNGITGDLKMASEEVSAVRITVTILTEYQSRNRDRNKIIYEDIVRPQDTLDHHDRRDH